MRRYATRLLLAYAISVTLLAAWFGCGRYVYWHVSGVGPSPTYGQFLASWNVSIDPVSPMDQLTMMIAVAKPANLAVACFAILLACLMLGHRKGTTPTQMISDIKKD